MGELVASAKQRSRTLEIPADRNAIALERAKIVRLSEVLRGDFVAVIAEIKRSSPSKGDINRGIDSGEQARCYERGGAAAISVLTETERFGGADSDVAQVQRAASLPILKKDFHVTEGQLVHAAQLGVSAALVIVRAVDPRELHGLASVATDVDLEIVYEVRDERELERALSLDARIIGVNNRNLETLEIDRDTVSRIVPSIPSACIAIAESGYSSVESVSEAASAGADAILVGSSLSASGNPEDAVRSIASVGRHPR